MKIWVPLIIVFFFAIILAFYIRYLLHVWVKESKLRNLTINLLLSLLTVLCIFICMEIIIGTFFVQSDGQGYTLASKRWFQMYWKPINSEGYRDFEHKWEGKKILFVLGDSIVAGHGIKNISERFSGVLQKKLGNDWTVAVLAKNGWGPFSEYRALVDHPEKPDRIIVSHYINDIETAAKLNGFNKPKLLVKLPSRIIRPFVNHSFLINWVYWRLYRKRIGGIYWNYIKHTYNDDNVWKSHEQELLKFIKYADQINSEIAFIVWPRLRNIDESLEFTDKVANYLEWQNVKVLDLGRHFSGRNPDDLVVNKLDGHPNIVVNAEVASFIYELLYPWD